MIASVGALTTLFAATARAQGADWLELDAPSACGVTATSVATQLEERLVDERAPELRARVAIKSLGRGYEARIALSRDDVAMGNKVVHAANCSEAVGGAVAVLALALAQPPEHVEVVPAESTEPEGAPTEPAPNQAEPRPPPRPRWRVGVPTDAAADGQTRPQQASSSETPRHQVALLTGLDSATLAQPSAFLALGYGWTRGALDLRGSLRYGFPQQNEEKSDGQEGITRVDERSQAFAALDVAACLGLGEVWRGAACAGGEAGAVYVQRKQSSAGAVTQHSEPRARLAGALTGVLSYRGAAVQPVFEASAVAPAVGGVQDAPRVGFRAAVGAAMHF